MQERHNAVPAYYFINHQLLKTSLKKSHCYTF